MKAQKLPPLKQKHLIWVSGPSDFSEYAIHKGVTRYQAKFNKVVVTYLKIGT